MPENPEIIILDDEPDIVSEFTDWLSLRGMSCLGTTDPDAALHLLATHATVRVVLLDRRMPRMDGYEFIRRARIMSKSQSGMLFVMITGHLTEEDFADARAHGAHALWSKPLDIAGLEQNLREMLAVP